MIRIRGQGMTEYIIIVALIALAAIAATSYFGQAVRHQVAAMSNEVAGTDSGGSIKAAGSAADAAETAATTDKKLANYNEGNLASGGTGGGGGK